MSSIQNFRSCGIFLFKIENNELKLLLLKSSANSSLPYHRSICKGLRSPIDMNDLDNAQRETLEEANQNIFDYDILDIETLTYEYDLYRQGVLCKKSVTGFFALKKTDSPIILSDEHISYEWVSRSRLSQLFEVELQDFLLTAYQTAFERFENYYINNLADRLSAEKMIIQHFNN